MWNLMKATPLNRGGALRAEEHENAECTDNQQYFIFLCLSYSLLPPLS